MNFDGNNFAEFYRIHVDQAVWLGAALGGRMMYVLQEVKRGARTLVSVKTGLDIAMVPPLALIANGICDHYSATGSFKASVIGIASYLGPRIIDMTVDVWKSTKQSKNENGK